MKKTQIPNPEEQIRDAALTAGTPDAVNFGDRRLAAGVKPSDSAGLSASSRKPVPRRRPLILVVDDEPDIVFVTRLRIQKSGYDAAVADNGQMALERIVELRPDLVLLDLKMPKLNGYQLCKTVKSDPDLRGIPILICSATGSLGINPERHCLEIGADGYIRKPYDIRKLLLEISRLLAQRSATLVLGS